MRFKRVMNTYLLVIRILYGCRLIKCFMLNSVPNAFVKKSTESKLEEKHEEKDDTDRLVSTVAGTVFPVL